jgi:hypothetical protein
VHVHHSVLQCERKCNLIMCSSLSENGARILSRYERVLTWYVALTVTGVKTF